jgi:hypothetical protein
LDVPSKQENRIKPKPGEGRVLMKIWGIEACTDKDEVDEVRQYMKKHWNFDCVNKYPEEKGIKGR